MVFFLLFLSSFAGFILEIAWIRKLSFVFGNFHVSTTMVFAALFLGYSAGNYFSSKGVRNVNNTFRRFSLLNIIALCSTIAAYFLFSYSGVTAYFYNLLFLKFQPGYYIVQYLLVSVLLFPWAFCYGSSFPLLISVTPGNKNFAYFLFTIAGVAGLLTGAFILLPMAGLQGTIVTACVMYLFTGLTGYIIRSHKKTLVSAEITEFKSKLSNLKFSLQLSLLGLISGFCSMGFELLGLRAFNLVDNNSYYSFSIILALVLISFSIGAMLVSVFSKKKFIENAFVLPVIFVIAGISIVAAPFLFVWLSDGILPLPHSASWFGYLFNILKIALPVLVVPCSLIGMVFPMLIDKADKKGDSIGVLLTSNTIGTVLAVLYIGLGDYSLWKMMVFTGFLYSLSAFLYSVFEHNRGYKIVLSILSVAIGIVCIKTDLPVFWKNITFRGMEVIELQERGGEISAVVGNSSVSHIIVNNQYSIGSNRNINEKSIQAVLPLSMHENTKSICFIGMGTGITAGASLLYNPDSVIVCEISNGVEKLAGKYFNQYVHGLFNNSCVQIVRDDGRNYLAYNKNRYDVVIGDLFIPWQDGTAKMYTKEFYTNVREHLKQDGIFAQWLPLYQLSMDDFGIIVHTLTSIFGQVNMWRATFGVQEPSVVLICSQHARRFNPNRMMPAQMRSFFSVFDSSGSGSTDSSACNLLLHYCGNISMNHQIFEQYPINTDDKLPIEYVAPETYLFKLDKGNVLTNEQYAGLCRQLLDNVPPENDPYLNNVSAYYKGLVYKGLQKLNPATSVR